MTALILSYIAGALTTINPCVLPILPVMMGAALLHGRWGPVALAAGLATSFTIAGVAIAATGTLLGLEERTLRMIAAAMFLVAGITLLIPALQDRLTTLFSSAGNRGAELAQDASRYGLAGQFVVGALTGLVWTPCSGPALGAAFALATEAGGIVQAAIRMLFFALGAATVLALLAFGSKALIARRRHSLGMMSRKAKPVAGVIFAGLGLAVLTGFDKRIEAFLNNAAPDWLINLTTSI
jgi:cytochrome c-type biogenesis protein